MTDSEKLDLLLSEMQILKKDMQAMKEDMQVTKNDVQVLKEDMQAMKEDMQVTKNDVQVLKKDMHTMKKDIEEVKRRVIRTDLSIENEIRVNIKRVAEGHLDLSRNLHEATKIDSEKEMLSIRVTMLESEVREIKDRLEHIA